ncbi:hypothetical protein GJW-30_1_04345 [Variibacter gotjawalensis]|uniref:Alpha/beta hydrolase family protein n=1 Tax=Variibacter gotjawalensis TaxID=1333996 RepID=A0A0S3Q0T1_9BRAD|nr:hypothetical protein [Variibacter gotjawalensis]NIK47624.1 hypothetical protein [Variibacter gotjawalensis]RZS49521.1 hypothetical protein EV661_1955 [Variibacter gotjawalensis]BAT61784.1 hypothetical protein GJW-30_1_04345 [Variibacter gotjawalensis]
MSFRLGFVAAVAAVVAAILPARAEIIPAAQMARGMYIPPQQCAAMPYAVWVVVGDKGYCVRYYLSTTGGEGQQPVVFLQGDRMGRFAFRDGTFEKTDPSQDINTEVLQRMADNFSKLAQGPAIYLGRPGVEGSSGFHGHRKTWLELYVVNMALDAIKRKHGYAGFHLMGQSGGGSLVGGLLYLRDDIGCAVPGAGLLARLDSGGRPEKHPLLQYFDPVQLVGRIAQRRGLRVIVITDPQDRTVRWQYQSTFADQLNRAGGRVEQYWVQAVDDNRHGVVIYTAHAMARCVRGETGEQIRAALAELQQRHVAAAEDRRRRRAAGAPPPQS